jgi:hypothetical protein
MAAVAQTTEQVSDELLQTDLSKKAANDDADSEGLNLE